MKKAQAVCERGLIVVSVPASWVPHLRVGHNKETGRSALLHTEMGRAWEFWVSHSGPRVFQNYHEISPDAFEEGGGTWENRSVVQLFGCSAERIYLSV